MFEDDFSSFRNDVTPEKETESHFAINSDIPPVERVTIWKLLG